MPNDIEVTVTPEKKETDWSKYHTDNVRIPITDEKLAKLDEQIEAIAKDSSLKPNDKKKKYEKITWDLCLSNIKILKMEPTIHREFKAIVEKLREQHPFKKVNKTLPE